ncbi:hypothetical protein CFP71_39525 [Amycolatopsis thailandensis]|uniref:Uncharacterized protein n=1 Tax=Amycolatopsis thailandensis TaxID=589330 RepID=A0A229RE41_9PSEU|nr:hypothetical protein [Amycolatopsis thailandensis]OXM44943.1 hypothetical protein CFP71_39525 [Amycolatopsis thailandensis]
MTEQQPAYVPLPAFSTSFEGWTPNPEDLEQWANSVRVEVVEGYDPTFTSEVTDGDMEFADYGEARQLVEIDTNYKPTRDSEHAVRLTRSDAVKLAAALLEAVEDTFHYSRCGRLRPSEAKDLLDTIRDTEHQLAELRDHALNDLFVGTGLMEDPVVAAEENQR